MQYDLHLLGSEILSYQLYMLTTGKTNFAHSNLMFCPNDFCPFDCLPKRFFADLIFCQNDLWFCPCDLWFLFSTNDFCRFHFCRFVVLPSFAMFQVSLTRRPQHSCRIHRLTPFSESKKISPRQMFCFRFYCVCQISKHDKLDLFSCNHRSLLHYYCLAKVS